MVVDKWEWVLEYPDSKDSCYKYLAREDDENLDVIMEPDCIADSLILVHNPEHARMIEKAPELLGAVKKFVDMNQGRLPSLCAECQVLIDYIREGER